MLIISRRSAGALGGRLLPDFMETNKMLTHVKYFFGDFRRDERGVTLVEYGIAIALAVVVGTGALSVLAGEINGATVAAGNAMPPA